MLAYVRLHRVAKRLVFVLQKCSVTVTVVVVRLSIQIACHIAKAVDASDYPLEPGYRSGTLAKPVRQGLLSL